MKKEPDPSQKRSNLSDIIQSLWAPVAGFAGAVTLVVQVIQLWRGDQATVTYVATGLGFILVLIVMIWVGFSQENLRNSA